MLRATLMGQFRTLMMGYRKARSLRSQAVHWRPPLRAATDTVLATVAVDATAARWSPSGLDLVPAGAPEPEVYMSM